MPKLEAVGIPASSFVVGAFVSDDALLKQLYLITMQVTEKWTMPIKDWGNILMCLMVYFGDRVSVSL